MRTAAPTTARPSADRKRRRRLAAMAERAAAPERPFLGHGPRFLIHPGVSVACGPLLSEIARDLRDQALPIDREALDQIATFLAGPDSRLFEPSTADALDEAARLAHIQIRRKPSARSESRGLVLRGRATTARSPVSP